MDRKQWWGIQISKGDYSQRITKAMERYLGGNIQLLEMSQNYFQGQNKNIFNVRTWNTHLNIILFDYYQIEIISISLHPLQTLLVKTIWIYFDIFSLFWFLWAIFFVFNAANLSFLSVKLWIIQNDQLRPQDNFGVVELIVTTLFHLHWELGQGGGEEQLLTPPSLVQIRFWYNSEETHNHQH